MSTLTYHHNLQIGPGSADYVWEQTSSFDELIVSWNAKRPKIGHFKIYIAVKIEAIWSPPFLYAEWGSHGQKGGDVYDSSFSLRIKEDILELLEGRKASGFRIYLEGPHLDEFYFLHACVSIRSEVFPEQSVGPAYSIDLPVPLISQMQLKHPRHRDMCSAASTSAAISYLLKRDRLDAVSFALQAHDDAFGIFGNWVLNIAQASDILGKNWCCWVQRLKGFDEIIDRLKDNTPVIVSVKGPLTGSALPYSQGHLLVVKGYLHEQKQVLCMDPAFSEDEKTAVSYDLQDFLQAWSRRQCMAYLFEEIQSDKSLSSQK